ncbi:MAG: hypothetical protein ACOCSF_01915 [Halanaeroarchaeum sp.]
MTVGNSAGGAVFVLRGIALSAWGGLGCGPNRVVNSRPLLDVEQVQH